jgi:pyruvate dehydrogenase E2 component (dihydrolipoamide acetyltransferase)
MALIEVKVPDIGDFKEVEVIELLVKPGDTVAAEQSLHYGGVRQGLDGDPFIACRRGQGDESQARRQGRRRQRGSWCSKWRVPPLRLQPAVAAAAPAACFRTCPPAPLRRPLRPALALTRCAHRGAGTRHR